MNLPTSAEESRLPAGMFWQFYLALALLLHYPVILWLRVRLWRGKEEKERWREKLGRASAARPQGTLIWLHAVGLGETLALPGLVHAMRKTRPELHFLITSSTRKSAQALKYSLPENCQHQFAPIDTPQSIRPFLAHWQPNLVIWSEQDIWPATIMLCKKNGLPLAFINARMGVSSYQKRTRLRGLYNRTFQLFDLIAAQDEQTALHINKLSPDALAPQILGSLKAIAAPLPDQPLQRKRFAEHIGARMVWLGASTHPEDETLLLDALQLRRKKARNDLLILAPRAPERGAKIAQTARSLGLRCKNHSKGELPDPDVDLFIADSFAEMGLWYRLASIAFIGGSIAPIGGHNPYEASRLDCAILHGPNLWNFTDDYAKFHQHAAAIEIGAAPELADLLDQEERLAACRAQQQAVLADADQIAQAYLKVLFALLDEKATE